MSRIPGFYELSIKERRRVVASLAHLSEEDISTISNCGAAGETLMNAFIENFVGSFSLPLGVATNFLINEKEVLIPMAVEESSVIAAASHGAKFARLGGGFNAHASEPIMTGQIQMYLNESRASIDKKLSESKEKLIAYANKGHERLISRGGGVQDIHWRHLEKMSVIHIDIHTADAMGANIVNTICEKLAHILPDIIKVDVGLKILTNLTDKRMVISECDIPALAFDSKHMSGQEIIERIEQAYFFADQDIYRAATHNKGVMNGIDPVLIATGNDWRAIEAGAHAYASISGQYKPMTQWKVKGEVLSGRIEIPMAIGTVGGVTKLHPTAQTSLKLMSHPNAKELSEIIASVGLAQNLSALRALATEGIQHGHMKLHQNNLDLIQGGTRS